MNVERTVDWLLTQARAEDDPTRLIELLVEHLDADGLQIDRLWHAHMTLHPQTVGTVLRWVRGAGVHTREVSHGTLPTTDPGSAVADVEAGATEGRRRLSEADLDPRAREIRDQGYTDYWVAPGPAARDDERARAAGTQVENSRSPAACAWATRKPGGWSDSEIAALRRVHHAFSTVLVALHVADQRRQLLGVYLGEDAADRVIRGQVQRGEVRRTEAALLFTDLRGFTRLSEALSPQALIALLNDAFDAQITEIEAAGGSVLQIVGDGLLAIFESGDGPGAACRAALDAVTRIETALVATNQRRTDAGQVAIGWGAGLHHGEIHHGNFGTPRRLVFTVNGPAVNQAARLEALGARLGIRPALSRVFVEHAGVPASARGAHQAKGLAEPLAIYALDS